MIDPLEIRKEIARLEYEESSYPNYAKLATLYTIRNEMEKGQQTAEPTMQIAEPHTARMEPAYSRSAGGSVFLNAVNGKPIDRVLSAVDELMDSLSVSQPKLYEAFLNKLKRL